MPGTNNIQVHVVADTKQFTAALAGASVQSKEFGAAINQAGATQAAVAGERQLAVQTRTMAQAWVEARMAMIASEEQANAILKSGRHANVASMQAALDEIDARHDAFLATTRAYYKSLTQTQQGAFAEQETAANKEIEAEYQRVAARLDAATAVDADTAAIEGNTVALTFNAQAQRESSYAIGEALTGRYGRLETTMFSLGARTGLVARLMSPLGAAIRGTAAAVGLFSFAAIEGARHAEAFQNALLVTGNTAGVTTADLEALTQTLAQGDTTLGTAREALLAMAKSGRFTGQAMQEAAQATVDFANLTGDKIPEASQVIVRLAANVRETLLKLEEQYHFLTAAQLIEIHTLIEEGNVAKASQLAVEDFGAAMHARATQGEQDAGGLLRAWEGVKYFFSEMWGAAEQVGAPDSVDKQIVRLENRISDFDSRYGTGNSLYAPVRARMEAELRQLEQEKRGIEALASQHASHNAAMDNLTNQLFGHKSHAASDDGGLAQRNAALDRITNANRAAADKEIADDERVLATLQAIGDAKSETAEQVLQIRMRTASQALDAAVAAGKMSASQREQVETRLTTALYQQDLLRLQNELTTLDPQTIAYQRVSDQIQLIKTQEVAALARLDHQYVTQSTREISAQAASWRGVVGEIENSESGMVSDILTRRRGLSQDLLQLGSNLVTKEIANDLRAVTTRIALEHTAGAAQKAAQQGGYLYHLMTEAEKTASSIAGQAARTSAAVAGNTARTAAAASATMAQKGIAGAAGAQIVMADAAKAFSGTYAAVSHIPYVGWILAPIAGAAAFAAVAAYEGMASLDTGTMYVPRDMPAMLHQGEAVLPRPFAQDYRSRLGTSATDMEGAGIHYHHHEDINVADTDIHAILSGPGAREAVVSAIGEAISRGYRG